MRFQKALAIPSVFLMVSKADKGPESIARTPDSSPKEGRQWATPYKTQLGTTQKGNVMIKLNRLLFPRRSLRTSVSSHGSETSDRHLSTLDLFFFLK